MHAQFEFQEIERIRIAVTNGAHVVCPRCGGLLDRTDVPVRDDVSYVRHRIWLICTPCGAGVVMDRPRMRPL
jgi:ribosomal protein S27AE